MQAIQEVRNLTLGSNNADEYYKKLELAIIWANIDEDKETTMDRFLHGLNRVIAGAVSSHYYEDLDDVIQYALKVEQQFKQSCIN